MTRQALAEDLQADLDMAHRIARYPEDREGFLVDTIRCSTEAMEEDQSCCKSEEATGRATA